MKIKEAITLFKYQQKANLKKRTIYSYDYLLRKFREIYANRSVDSITVDEIYHFLETLTDGYSKATRRLRYAQLKTFFTFIIDKCSLNIKNPCSSPLLSKTFRMPTIKARKILDKESVDEMIYNTNSGRDRLILELQARCGLRIGELLGLTVSDISDRKIIIREPKSGKESEVAFMPEQIAKRMDEYIKGKGIRSDDKIFPISYSTARSLIMRLGKNINVRLSPHDLRRHSATYASRNGVPLEIVSKVILRHHDLKTTQVYLGKVSESEALRWMDILHGK
ncbi:MAG: tyrosine-type recombinase/integrase, partial [Candidatus Hodarchaeales archaeon]|jgi:integrase